MLQARVEYSFLLKIILFIYFISEKFEKLYIIILLTDIVNKLYLRKIGNKSIKTYDAHGITFGWELCCYK